MTNLSLPLSSVLQGFNTVSNQQNSTNAPRPKTVVEFWNYIISKGGAAKQSRFATLINQPKFDNNAGGVDLSAFNNIRDLIFQCDSAELPPRNISTYDAIISGPNIKLPYQTAYQDLNLTFFCTNDMYEKRLFDSWLDYINDNNTFLFSYRDEYATTITTFQYDETNNVTYSVRFFEAFPIAISAMPLVWGEQNIHRVTVTFAYTKWKSYGKNIKIQGIPSFDLLGLSGLGATIGDIRNFVNDTRGFVNQTIGQVLGPVNQVVNDINSIRNLGTGITSSIRSDVFGFTSAAAQIENSISSVFNIRI